MIVDGQIYGVPRYSQSMHITASPDPAYAVPQAVGQQVAPLNRVAEKGVRVAGVAAQATVATALTVAPDPTGATKLAAAYMWVRTADEGQALVRELYTGTPTEGEAHKGIRMVAERAGATPQGANLYASAGLGATDAFVGVAGFRSMQQGSGKPVEGIKQEGRQAQEPAPVTEPLPTSQPEPTQTASDSTVPLAELRDQAAAALGKGTQYKSTGVGRYAKGQVKLASSDDLVPRPQRDWADQQGLETVRGKGHAEVTLKRAETEETGPLVEVEVDSPHGRTDAAPHGAICIECENELGGDVKTTSPFSGKPAGRRRQ